MSNADQGSLSSHDLRAPYSNFANIAEHDYKNSQVGASQEQIGFDFYITSGYNIVQEFSRGHFFVPVFDTTEPFSLRQIHDCLALDQAACTLAYLSANILVEVASLTR